MCFTRAADSSNPKTIRIGRYFPRGRKAKRQPPPRNRTEGERLRETVRCPTCGSSLPSGCSIPHLDVGSRDDSRLRLEVLRVSDLLLNPVTHDASRAGRNLALSRNEFRLLESLMRRSGRVVSRSALIHLV